MFRGSQGFRDSPTPDRPPFREGGGAGRAAQGVECRVSGVGCGVWNVGCRVLDVGCRVLGVGCRA